MSRSPYSKRSSGGFYRSRNGMILGVCQGIADYFECPPALVRLVFLLLLVFSVGLPMLIIYLILGIVMKPEPVLPLASDDDREFYNSYTASHTMALRRLKQTFDNLDRRIQRMEDIVTTRGFGWEERLK